MATLSERIQTDLTAAMKSRDELVTRVLRMVKSALTTRELNRDASSPALADREVEQVMATLVKQREDAIALYDKGGRADLAQAERAEIAVLKAYLPQDASDAEIDAAVEHAVTATGATSAKDLGKVMKAAMAALKAAGKPVDGKRVNAAAAHRLR